MDTDPEIRPLSRPGRERTPAQSLLERAGLAAQEAIATAYGEGLESQAWRDHVARAVLQAIREPTEAMIYANSEGGLGFNDQVVRDWQAMIDAALEEG